ncbi:aminoglycoside phosphotransferase family protein [Amycolatopsis sp. H20-H5]|uniref:aminoglycoside phosphotransferase family protein n=1 Tax=Amycolatopsis sp. H20-H5 TaxID=3046309 RepID=UPI002DBD8AE1|nr:aminoglycoside 3'-phosphotransferase/choline kinase family protein [Amycolatopsis sp. H20-H5]MEC3979774.1 aminoglycoside 3'-phosphotransferase/choline kinase family protein [Amycolatopsis sp. H20-H5]
MALFPPAGTEDEFGTLTREALLPAVISLAGSLGAGEAVVPFTEGSLPVYAVGDELVLKLYPSVYFGEMATERTMLEVLHGRLPITTPGVERTGELEGWGYLLMDRLPGDTLKDVWPRLSTEDKQRLAPRLGEALAALHAVDDPALAALGPASWSRFIADQRGNVVKHHRKTRLGEKWLSQLDGFLDSVELGTPRVVPLHTEFVRDHLMMTREGGEWRVSGLFDFEPAMRGAAEYEFVGAGLFVAGGDRDFLRRLLLGYGYKPAELGEDFSRRCLAYTLLHVYSNLRRYLELLPVPAEPTLDTLATTW